MRIDFAREAADLAYLNWDAFKSRISSFTESGLWRLILNTKGKIQRSFCAFFHAFYTIMPRFREHLNSLSNVGIMNEIYSFNAYRLYAGQSRVYRSNTASAEGWFLTGKWEMLASQTIMIGMACMMALDFAVVYKV